MTSGAMTLIQGAIQGYDYIFKWSSTAMAQRRWHARCRDEIDVHKELHEARPNALDRYELDAFNHAKKRRNGLGV
jgi:hypothetical protein